MSGAAMGFLGGLGRGVASVADTMIQSNEKQKLTELEAQIQAERDKRIEEAAIAREGRQEQYKIAGEQRDLSNDKTRLQNTIDVNTDPANIERVGKATVEKQRYEDEYKDTRLPADVARAKALADATRGPDHTDWEGRGLDNQLKRKTLERMNAPGYMDENEKSAIKDYKEDIKTYSKQQTDLWKLAQEEQDPIKQKEYQAKADALQLKINQANVNIQSIRKGDTETVSEGNDAIKAQDLILKIRSLEPGYNFPEGGVDLAGLEKTYNELKSGKATEKPAEEKPKDNKPGFFAETIKKVKDTASDIVKPQEANKDLMDKARSILLNGPKALGEMPSDPEEAYNYKRLAQAINYTLKSDMSEEQKLDDIYRKLSGR